MRSVAAWTLLFWLFAAAPSSAQEALAPVDRRDSACSPESTRLLIVGTYHMANPGQDAVNLAVDDPTSPQRSRELAELLDLLARFQPTRVAIEATYGRSPWLARYREYLAGTYQLGKNEIELVGFQLARRAGLTEVSAVDYPMWMDGRVPDEIDYDWRPPIVAAAAAVKPAASNPEEELLRRSTVLEYIRHLNSDDYMRADHAGYMKLLRPDTTGNSPFAQANLLTNWYKRNFRIFTNLHRISGTGSQRVLLLIGSGHLTLLRQLAIDSPDFCLVETARVLQ